MPSHVGVNITREARDELRSLAYALTGKAGRRVTLSEALTAAARLASAQLDQAAEHLPEGPDE